MIFDKWIVCCKNLYNIIDALSINDLYDNQVINPKLDIHLILLTNYKIVGEISESQFKRTEDEVGKSPQAEPPCSNMGDD